MGSSTKSGDAIKQEDEVAHLYLEDNLLFPDVSKYFGLYPARICMCSAENESKPFTRLD